MSVRPTHARELDEKQRGEMAELAFMYKAATLGFAVAKPWGDSDRYDAVVRAGRVFWRVQIKSAWAREPGRAGYAIKTERRVGVSYTCDEIDFLVACIFAVDAWYIFPMSVMETRKGVSLRPGSKRSRFGRYREAWDLMRDRADGHVWKIPTSPKPGERWGTQ
jgi:PD-(D/E)XK endonuclease